MKLESLMFYLVLMPFLKNIILSKSIPNESKVATDGFQYAENYELEEEPRQSLRQIRKSHQNPKRYAIVKKRSLRSNSINHKGLKKRTCGIMYRNKEPIGILQPFEESYKLLPVNNQKINLEINDSPYRQYFNGRNYEETDEENYQRSEDAVSDQRSITDKRNDTPKKKRHIHDVFRSASSFSEQASVEDQLRDILQDMGLIDYEYVHKREVKEDENLEKGDNSVNMEKGSNSKGETKRHNRKISQEPVESNFFVEDDVSFEGRDGNVQKRCQNNKFKEHKRSLKRLNEDARLNAERKLNFLLNSVRWKNQRGSRMRREGLNHRQKRNDTQPQKTLNHPSPTIIQKFKTQEDSDLSEYEQRIQRQIQQKINALKEEVKREIASLDGQNRMKSQEVNEFIRKKREIGKRSNTLMDAETIDLNPAFNMDQDIIPKIRRRRQADFMPKDDFLRDLNYLNISTNGSCVQSTENPSATQQCASLPSLNISEPVIIPNQTSGEFPSSTIIYSRNIKCNSNDADVNITYLNGQEDIHISINTSVPSRQNKRHIFDSYPTPEKIDKLIQESKITHINSNIPSNEIMGIQQPKYDSFDTVVHPAKKTDIYVNDGLPYYIRKRSCTSGNCGKTNAGENCDCGTPGCLCRKARLAVRDDRKVNEPRYDPELDAAEEGEEEFEETYYDGDEYADRRDARKRVLRGDKAAEYYIDMNPEIYKITQFNVVDGDEYEEMDERKKRYDEDDFVALHGGTATRNHMEIRSKNGQIHNRVRRRIDDESNNDPIQLIDMSEEDIFGALPQSFDGELNRYKRVK